MALPQVAAACKARGHRFAGFPGATRNRIAEVCGPYYACVHPQDTALIHATRPVRTAGICCAPNCPAP